jgi:F-type H+-transporting ATPase subunit b
MSELNYYAAGGEAPEGAGLFFPPLYEIVWSAIFFIGFFLIIWKFALPAMKKALAERTAGIEQKLEQAEIDRAEAQALLERYREQLAEAREEVARIRAEAQSERQSIVTEARTEAQEAAAAVTERAEAQLAAEAEQIRFALSRDVGRIAVELAEKIVGETLDPERTSATVDRFIAELESAAVPAGTAAGSAAADDVEESR